MLRWPRWRTRRRRPRVGSVAAACSGRPGAVRSPGSSPPQLARAPPPPPRPSPPPTWRSCRRRPFRRSRDAPSREGTCAGFCSTRRRCARRWSLVLGSPPSRFCRHTFTQSPGRVTGSAVSWRWGWMATAAAQSSHSSTPRASSHLPLGAFPFPKWQKCPPPLPSQSHCTHARYRTWRAKLRCGLYLMSREFRTCRWSVFSRILCSTVSTGCGSSTAPRHSCARVIWRSAPRFRSRTNRARSGNAWRRRITWTAPSTVCCCARHPAYPQTPHNGAAATIARSSTSCLAALSARTPLPPNPATPAVRPFFPPFLRRLAKRAGTRRAGKETEVHSG
mmetsp:Transcript_21248/g.53866  ORF Transcript_21248/g.53866 Transcript_21248/m.53866 type:complete len:334 (+) Transcript_21248:336-1337(+)